MNEFTPLLINKHKLKDKFIEELAGVLSKSTAEQVRFRKRYTSSIEKVVKHETLELSKLHQALILKCNHIIHYRGGLKDVLALLDACTRNTKNLRSCGKLESLHEQQYKWINKSGNEKLSHSKNLPKAHFRWNGGQRYTLEELDKTIIRNFIAPLLKIRV